MYTLGNLLTDVNTRIAQETGTVSAATVTNYTNEALRRIRRKFDLPSAEVITQFPLYSGVYQYAVPYTGYKEFVALRDNFRTADSIFMRNVSEDSFWSLLQAGNTKSELRNGLTRTLLFNLVNPTTASATVNSLQSPTFDGTWTASGDANTLGTDTLFFRTGSSSLSFNITPSTGTATLVNSTMSPKDLSGIAFLNTAMFTPWLYLPAAGSYTGIRRRFGSDASNYYENTVTANIDGSAFQAGWNQLGFDWTTATTTGTPNTSAITYLQYVFTFPASMANQTGLRLSFDAARQRQLFNLHSTTDYLIIDGSTGTPKETFDSSTDTSSYFNCDRSFVDFLLYTILESIFVTHIDDQVAKQYYETLRMEAEQDLLMRFPSKRQPEMQEYMDDTVYQNWLNR